MTVSLTGAGGPFSHWRTEDEKRWSNDTTEGRHKCTQAAQWSCDALHRCNLESLYTSTRALNLTLEATTGRRTRGKNGKKGKVKGKVGCNHGWIAVRVSLAAILSLLSTMVLQPKSPFWAHITFFKDHYIKCV